MAPVNMDNRHFLCPDWKALIHRQPCFMDTGYLNALSELVTNFSVIEDVVG